MRSGPKPSAYDAERKGFATNMSASESTTRIAVLSLVCFICLVCFPTARADPFPLPMVEERRGGLLYLAHPDVPTTLDDINKKKRHAALAFESVGVDSDILSSAFSRYQDILSTPRYHMAYEFEVTAPSAEALLDPANRVDRVVVYVQSADQTLDVYTDETYSIRISSPDVTIEAQTVYGALRALETLAQSTHVLTLGIDTSDTRDHIYGDVNVGRSNTNVLVLNETALYDSPRFRHRGVLIDTARHFLPLSIIKTHMDAMVLAKMNVLHWHMTDDESWPYEVAALPELSEKGAFSGGRVYDRAAVEEVVAYGKARGVRVVVEFDSPGHAGSLVPSHPELLVACRDDYGEVGLLNPGLNATYDLLWKVFRDAARVFPDRAWHFGGDGVRDAASCWGASEAVMRVFGNVGAAVVGHVRRILGFAVAMGKIPILYSGMWEIEAVRRAGVLPEETVVQVWTPERVESWKDTMDGVTKGGYRAVLSSPWNVGHATSAEAWKEFWEVEPLSFGRRRPLEQLDKVLGGEVVVWGEMVDETNSVSKTWPIAAAVGERLWSQEAVRDVVDAEQRLFRVRCRMVARGVGASPVKKGECPFIDTPVEKFIAAEEPWILT